MRLWGERESLVAKATRLLSRADFCTPVFRVAGQDYPILQRQRGLHSGFLCAAAQRVGVPCVAISHERWKSRWACKTVSCCTGRARESACFTASTRAPCVQNSGGFAVLRHGEREVALTTGLNDHLLRKILHWDF